MTVRAHTASRPLPASLARTRRPARSRRILLWHVHGSWTTAFVHSGHTCVLPLDAERGPDGRGRARTWNWPVNAVEVPVGELRDTDVDLVVLQRPHEVDLAERLLGRFRAP